MDMTTKIRCLDATNTSIKSVHCYLYISLTSLSLYLLDMQQYKILTQFIDISMTECKYLNQRGCVLSMRCAYLHQNNSFVTIVLPDKGCQQPKHVGG